MKHNLVIEPKNMKALINPSKINKFIFTHTNENKMLYQPNL